MARSRHESGDKLYGDQFLFYRHVPEVHAIISRGTTSFLLDGVDRRCAEYQQEGLQHSAMRHAQNILFPAPLK
jgi:hypothetical protein